MTELTASAGDKIKLKRTSEEPGAYGTVVHAEGLELTVRLRDSDKVIGVTADKLINFSLAARKAWKRMPARNVGRPKGSRISNRISVTIRLDRDLWQRFRDAEASGLISDRTATLNSWLADQLNHLPVPREAS